MLMVNVSICFDKFNRLPKLSRVEEMQFSLLKIVQLMVTSTP